MQIAQNVVCVFIMQTEYCSLVEKTLITIIKAEMIITGQIDFEFLRIIINLTTHLIRVYLNFASAIIKNSIKLFIKWLLMKKLPITNLYSTEGKINTNGYLIF